MPNPLTVSEPLSQKLNKQKLDPTVHLLKHVVD